jgi:glycosyltransferase involved in cell wall biosynthesis
LHDVPWIADLRDPWALDEMRVYQSAAHRKLELRHMRHSLESAAAIVMNTPEARTQLKRVFPEFSDRAHSIPNGYDSADFEMQRDAPGDDGSFRIVHTGDLHTAFGLRHRSAGPLRRVLGGTLGEVDVLARSHVFLLEAVDRLFDRRPELRGAVEIHLAGEMDAADTAAIRGAEVIAHGYLTHAEAIRLMRTADLLFLPMHGLPHGQRARIVPGKTYEYLASDRPILAAVPEGDARDLLDRADSALFCCPSDVECMARVIESQVDRKIAGLSAPKPRREVLRPYERQELTSRLAALFDSISST